MKITLKKYRNTIIMRIEKPGTNFKKKYDLGDTLGFSYFNSFLEKEYNCSFFVSELPSGSTRNIFNATHFTPKMGSREQFTTDPIDLKKDDLQLIRDILESRLNQIKGGEVEEKEIIIN